MAITALVALAPWSWFVVRDVDARLDAVALAWPVLAVAGSVPMALGAPRRPRRLVPAGSWLLAALVVIVSPWQPLPSGEPAEPLRLAAANVHGRHADVAELLDAFDRQDPDVVVISEVTERLDEALRKRFRNHARSHRIGRGIRRDVGLYSDLPIEATALPAGLGDQHGVRVTIEAPRGAMVLYGLHLDRPGLGPGEVGFRTHRRIIERLTDAIEQESAPVVVSGDLNLGDRTSGYRRLTDVLDDAMRADWIGPTFVAGLVQLALVRIDHIFMPEGWCSADSRTFTLPGSDHRGVTADVGPCR